MIEAYKGLKFPQCGVGQLNNDYENKLNTSRRLALQLIDFSRFRHQTYHDKLEEAIKEIKDAGERGITLEELVDLKKGEKNKGNTNEDDAEIVRVSDTVATLLAITNIRFSRELPICGPLCLETYNNYTYARIKAAKDIGYDLMSISSSAGDYAEETFFNYFWPSGKGNPSLDEADRAIRMREKLALKKLLKASDLEMGRVRDDVVNLKRDDEEAMEIVEHLSENYLKGG